MKKIIITGKSNIEAVKGIKHKKRATMKDISDINVFDIKQQIESIKKLYGSCDFKYKNLYSREIKKKLSGYKQQDIKKHKLDKNLFITFDDLIEKMIISKHKCFYCRNICKILFTDLRDPKQWTLERKDNSIGHTTDNVEICCYKCNIKRGTKNSEAFRFAKQMKIIKHN
jgi:hypothetical protein